MSRFAPAGESDFESGSEDEPFDIFDPAMETAHVHHSPDGFKSSSYVSLGKEDSSSTNPLAVNDLHTAITVGNLKAVKRLLEGCGDPNFVLKSGWTLLMLAAYFCQLPITKYLLVSGADPNFPNATGNTALHVVCKSNVPGNEDNLISVVKALLNAGANAITRDQTGRIPAMYAARRNSVDVVKMFLQLHQATEILNCRDDKGWTVVDWAAAYGQTEVLKLLEDFGHKIGVNHPSYSLWPKHVRDHVSHCLENSEGNENGSLHAAAEVSCDRIVPVQDITARQELPQCLPQQQIKTSQSSVFLCDVGKDEVHEIIDEEHSFPAKVVQEKLEVEGYETYGQLELFLLGLDLARLIPVFKEQDISFEQLLCLSMEELEAVGITALGTRKRILVAIHECHEKHTTTSIISDYTRTPLNADNLLNMMAGASEQMSYIASCMQYVKHHIDISPDTLKPVECMKYDQSPVLAYVDKINDINSGLADLAGSFKLLKIQAAELEKNASSPYFKPHGIVTSSQSGSALFFSQIVLGFSIVLTVISFARRFGDRL